MSTSKLWVFEEAEKLLRHVEKKKKSTPIVFQTGFGPSGLPHIGTFAEVTRTTFLRHVFEKTTNRKAQLIAFSDDMDGLRKVPGNLPNPELIQKNLGKPLCHVPDPFGTAASFSDHMNEKLIEFLHRFEINFEHRSSRDTYTQGKFNDVLQRVLENVEKIKGVILPTLQPENRAEWSPFMPICEQCGKNLTTIVTGYDPKKSEIAYECRSEAYEGVKGCGHKSKQSILNGKAKVGWKVDWAVRWTAFDVDFEMYGKDLIESFQLSHKICKILGGTPPQDYFYEMFLDEEGKKISKSVGKGLTIDDWLNYAPLESLSYYIFNNPRRAKKLHWDVIPKCVDEYLTFLHDYSALTTEEEKQESPIWHIHFPHPEKVKWNADINFSLINNLVSALGSDDPKLIHEYIERYDPEANQYPEVLNPMIGRSFKYYRDFIHPTKKFTPPSDSEKKLLQTLESKLKSLPASADSESIQKTIFGVSKENNIEPKDFFGLLYRSLLGQESGPRLGAFFRLLGLPESIKRLEEARKRV